MAKVVDPIAFVFDPDLDPTWLSKNVWIRIRLYLHVLFLCEKDFFKKIFLWLLIHTFKNVFLVS
jgi:hypothetical protein